MIGAFTAMAWNGFREASRNRVTVVVAGFAGVMLLSTTLVADVTVWTFDRVLTDFGLSVMAFIEVGLAIYLSCGLLPKEIERRTIFLVVSRPVSRGQFLVSRLAGNMITLLILMGVMTALMAGELVAFRSPLTQPMFAAVFGLAMELLVLSAAGFFFSSFAGNVVSAICTVALYFSGHLSIELWRLAEKQSDSGRTMIRAIYYLLPNLEKVNFRPFAAYGTHVPGEMIVSGTLYSLCYAAVLVTAAILIFDRRDFK
jgi:ABC-type transport system involved in multi-copper enzyme maturation permease subunit